MSQNIQTFIGGFAKAFALVGRSTILVDCGPKGNSITMEKALNDIGIKPSDVSLIVLTHGHWDHVGSLSALRELTGAPVLCHKNAAAALEEGWGEEIIPRTAPARVMTRFAPKNTEKNRRPIKADITVTEETDLAAYGVAAKILPTPGHTSGSLSVITDEKEAIIGDLIMKFPPLKPALSLLSNNVDDLKASLRKLLDAGVQNFHLAHGGMITRKAVEGILAKSSR